MLIFLSIKALPSQDQMRAISMLSLLLPHENRNTIRELLKFLRLVVEQQEFNKMSIHNVATITGKIIRKHVDFFLLIIFKTFILI